MAREREARAPILRVVLDEPAAQPREAIGVAGAHGERFEALEREIGAVGRDLEDALPDRGRVSLVALRDADVAEIQIRGHRTRVEVDGGFESPRGFGVFLPAHRLEADLVFKERQNRLVLGPWIARQLREPLSRVIRLGPLVLFLVQLLQVQQRVLVLRIETKHFGEGLERALDEAAALVVEPEAQQHVRMFESAEPRPLQQILVHGDRLADLTFLAIQVAEDHVHLERIGVEARGAAQFLDGEIDLVGDEEVEAEDIVRRLACATAIDPLAVAQLVALPRLADGETREQRDQGGEKGCVRAHFLLPRGQTPAADSLEPLSIARGAPPPLASLARSRSLGPRGLRSVVSRTERPCLSVRYSSTSGSHLSCARKMTSMSSRTAP